MSRPGQVRLVADEPHFVAVVGREIEPDELFEVPAELIAAREWNANFQIVDPGETAEAAGPAKGRGSKP